MNEIIPRIQSFIGDQDPNIGEYLCILSKEDHLEYKEEIIKFAGTQDSPISIVVLGSAFYQKPNVFSISVSGRTVHFMIAGSWKDHQPSIITPLTAMQKL